MEEPAPDLRDRLEEQKYPTEGANVFKTNYYEFATNGVIDVIRRGGDRDHLNRLIRTVPAYGNPGRQKHNRRVLEAFRDGSLVGRSGDVFRARSGRMLLRGVVLRCFPDLDCDFGDGRRSVFLHVNEEPIAEATARTALELAYLVLHAGDPRIGREQFELIDLGADRVFTIPRLRPTLLRRAGQTADVVSTMWSLIERAA